MSLKTSAGGNDYPITPEGQYTARCFKIIDLGTQWVEWMGDKKQQRKVMITWELLDKTVKMSDGKPWAATKKYTNSLDERGRLRPDLESWRGKKFTEAELEEFDLIKVLGAYCTIQIVHDETGKYANVQTIMAYKGDKPEPVNPDVAFDIDAPDMQIFETFSDRMKEQIQSAQEWQVNQATKAAEVKQSHPTDDPEDQKAIDTYIDSLQDEPINLDDIPF